MKVAGVIGFILALALIGFFIYSLTQSSSSPSAKQTFALSNVSPDLIQSGGILVLFILIIVALELFLYGFLRMGNATGSRFLTFAARWQMILLIVMIALVIIFGLISMALKEDSSSSLTLLLYFFIVASLLYSFGIIISVVSSVGLIEISSRVRFAKSTGIFSAITIGFSLFIILFSQLSIALSIIVAFGGGGSALSSFPMILKTISILTNLTAFTSLILGSLALFDASAKFEK